MAVSTEMMKVIVLVVLFFGTFFFSTIPIKFVSLIRGRGANQQHRRRYKAIISFLSCYAAGVFLATCLLDLFPGVQNQFNTVMGEANIATNYPVTEFMLVFGLFMMLLTEQIVLTAHGGHSHHKPLQSPTESGSYGSTVNGSSGLLSSPGPSDSLLGRSQSASTDSSDSEDEDIAAESHETVEPKEETYKDPSSHSLMRSLMLLLALSLHSVFEGLAVGLQENSTDVLQIFLALCLHKCILAFSLGLNLAQSKMKVSGILKSNFIFAITSPIGIGIGLAVTDLSGGTLAAALTNGILEGLACGTFVYIVFFEILPHEFNTKSHFPNRLLKVLFLILGYGTVALLLLLDPDIDKPMCPQAGN